MVGKACLLIGVLGAAVVLWGGYCEQRPFLPWLTWQEIFWQIGGIKAIAWLLLSCVGAIYSKRLEF